MDEKYILISNDELMHWKYIKREKVKGKWKYYYDLSEVKKDAKSIGNKTRNRISSIFNKKTKTSKGAKVSSNKKTHSFVERLKAATDKVESLVNRAKKRVHKYTAKVPTGDGVYRYFYSDEAYKTYLNGKNAADKALDKMGNKKLGTLIKDSVKNAVSKFTSNIMASGFGKAVYNLALPALTAIQVAIQTPRSFADMKKIKDEQSNDEHQKAINPDYDPGKLDYSYNCSFCTAAYDLRKRGYDVEAMPISTLEGPVIEDILSWYDGAKAVSENQLRATASDERIYTPKARASLLEKSLEKYGDGARGHLAMYWSMGGGHDIVWEVENGKVVFRDCQTNDVVNMSEMLTYVDDYSFVRVDNCEPTEEVLRTVRNRK